MQTLIVIALVGVGVAVAGAVALSEILHWRASRSAKSISETEGSCGLVVLGYRPKRDGSAHPVQRWRVNIAARSATESQVAPIVMSGGPHGNGPSVASVLADYAELIGINADLLVVEERATTTGENIEFSLPMVEDCGAIAFCSDPMHAARARRYTLLRRPDLEGRLASATITGSWSGGG